jgi:predicted ester cyclase
MSAEENKAIARRHFEEVWNKSDLAVVDEIMAPDISYQGEHLTRDEWRDLLVPWRIGLPDFRYHVDQLIAEGDLVAANARITGTHRGVFHYRRMGPWAPTGNSVDARVMIFFRLAEGRIVEVQAIMDSAAFAQQLGGGPAPATTTT